MKILLRKTTLRTRGYTLIELLLYVAILSGLLLAVTSFFGLANEARIKSQTINEVNQQGSFMMDYMTQTVRNATSITLPLAAGSGPILTLIVPTTLQSPTSFGLLGTDLTVTKGVTNLVTVLDSGKVTVSGLTFTTLTRAGTNGIVQISFTLTYANTIGRDEYSYSQTFTSSAEVGY